ncbi:MAG: dihydrodipicolinate synthase family protein [Spirochaetota bacterium]
MTKAFPDFDPLVSLRGIITVLNTPFDASGSVDAAALARNVEYAIGAGVAGFLVPAMAAEVGRLEPEERRLLVSTTIRAAAGRVPVVGGASAPTRTLRRERAHELVELGCPCILAALPWSGLDEYLADIEDLGNSGVRCVMVQDWDATGQGAPVDAIALAFERIPAFKSIKVEVVPAGAKYSAILAATGGNLHVCGGWAVGQMIEGLDRGIHAFMPTGLHAVFSEIFRRYVAGERDSSQALFESILPVLAFSNQHIDLSLRFWKRFLWRQGFYPTASVREPLEPFDAIHTRTADLLIEKALGLEAMAMARNSQAKA